MDRQTNFILLRPQDLPANDRQLAHMRSLVADPLRPVNALFAETPALGVLTVVENALQALRLPDSYVTVVVDDEEESAGNSDNDRAFGIVRVTGHRALILAHTALRGYQILLKEALSQGTTMSPQEWGRLIAAFRQLLRLYSGLPAVSDTPARQPPAAPAGDRDALRRWTHGHHVFMVLVQALVVAIKVFADHVRRHRRSQASDTLARATSIMWGCQAALRFTGDFPYSEYETQVRPTLMPPTAPPEMSGLRWRDHEYLVKVLTNVRPLLGGLDRGLAPERDAFTEAVAATYDSHRSVCERFVGSDQPSVLMAPRSHKPAVRTLEDFKRSRTALVRADQPGDITAEEKDVDRES